MTQKKHKFDIFKVLGKISSKNSNFYGEFSEEEQKALQPLVVMRWLTGTRSGMQIYFLNELVNPFVFSMGKHKQLLVNLMTICAPGQPQKYYWNKAKSKKSSSTPMVVDVVREYFDYGTLEAIEALPLLTDENILWYAEELGRQPDELKTIKKELKVRV